MAKGNEAKELDYPRSIAVIIWRTMTLTALLAVVMPANRVLLMCFIEGMFPFWLLYYNRMAVCKAISSAKLFLDFVRQFVYLKVVAGHLGLKRL
jgi:hypothetical protein